MSDKKSDQRGTLAEPEAAITASRVTAPNYGTMHSAHESQSTLATKQHSETTQASPFIDAPPKPAIRRKIQERQQQQQTRDRSSSSSVEANMQETGTSQPTAADGKQLISLPSPGDFEAAHKHPSETVDAPPNHCQRPYPKKVVFIVANEFCERFSYYGLKTVLVLYFKSVLGYSDSASTISFHLFTTLCYMTPILGAILGDSIWGKYKTILYLSIVYFMGEFVLVLSSIFWDLNNLSKLITFLGLLLIGIGTGGIKPCVSAFGGDQFHSHETRWRESFFSLFYASINLGSLVSIFLTPMLRSKYQCVGRSDCYPLAFGVPCAVMLVAILVFVAAHRYYTVTALPERNVILAFFQCVWLALKRKFRAGPNGANSSVEAPGGQVERSLVASFSAPTADNTSSSSLSMASGPDEKLVSATASVGRKALVVKQGAGREDGLEPKMNNPGSIEHDHWLYLASDQFDEKSIEEFKCVLGIFLLFLPTPVYWCLFDQQGSLWILQATRMDGRVPGTNFTLEPDQMMVANPILLLASIALFQWVFYPCLNSCNLLTSSIQRMTAGGFLAAVAFVASALVEFHLQSNLPPVVPPSGFSSLILVNGLSECTIVEPQISYVQIPSDFASKFALNNGTSGDLDWLQQQQQQPPQQQQQHLSLDSIGPLSLLQFNLLSPENNSMAAILLNNYQIKFKLASGNQQAETIEHPLNSAASNVSQLASAPQQTCPFDFSQSVELSVGVLPEKSSKLLYIEQGNGKLGYKLFNESMALPQAGKAKVRLLYEYFGSAVQASTWQFSLMRESTKTPLTRGDDEEMDRLKQQFHFSTHEGQVMLSDYMDVAISSTVGDLFKLKLSTESPVSSISLNAAPVYIQNRQNQQLILLKPGTRNLIIVHQRDSKSFEFNQQLLQGNNYRISMLYQLIPYCLISISEAMFSVTGLEFSYAMAPNSMKSLILGAWSLTTALGSVLTVAVESVHPFENLAHDFLFYAALLAVDMFIFALIGYHYKPYKFKTQNSVEIQ